MIKAKLTTRSPKLDVDGYRQALADNARETIREAAHEWLRVAVSIVPVHSGASRSTFAELSRDVGFQIDAAPAPGVRDGRAEGRAASDGGVEESRGVFSFHYETDLRGIVFREGSPLTAFTDVAAQAAESVIEDFVPPSLDRFIRSA